MRIGIIGTGRHGSRYANHVVHDFAGLQLTAIARRSEQGRKQAAEWGVGYFQHYKDLIDSEDVDAVIAAVPPAINKDIAHHCSRAKKPLLVEKPLAPGSREGEDIIRMMNDARTPITVGQTLRYNPVIEKLRTELPSQGRLFTVYANQRLEPSTLQWLENPAEAGGGITFHIAVHVFDALHYITGLKVTRVSAMCRTCRTKNLEDMALIHVEMEGGVAGIVDVSKLSTSRSGRYEFICENSQLHGDQIHGYVDRIAGAREQRVSTFEPVPTIPLILEQWQLFLQGKRDNPVTGDDGLYAIRVSEACLESSKNSSCWVNL